MSKALKLYDPVVKGSQSTGDHNRQETKSQTGAPRSGDAKSVKLLGYASSKHGVQKLKRMQFYKSKTYGGKKGAADTTTRARKDGGRRTGNEAPAAEKAKKKLEK